MNSAWGYARSAAMNSDIIRQHGYIKGEVKITENVISVPGDATGDTRRHIRSE